MVGLIDYKFISKQFFVLYP